MRLEPENSILKAEFIDELDYVRSGMMSFPLYVGTISRPDTSTHCGPLLLREVG